MNVGQVLETHLGWAAKGLGQKLSKMLDAKASVKEIKDFLDHIYNLQFHMKTLPTRKINFDHITEAEVMELANNLRKGIPTASPVFDGVQEIEIKELLKMADLPESGQTTLFDGRTGEAFERKITVGYMYMLKLNHLV